MCLCSILFAFFCWISYLGVKRQSGRKGERKRLRWGDSLRRGVHANETYLGRPCVHGAPKLPVLKHWLAVSCLFPQDSKRLLCLSFNISKGKKEWGGEGKIVLQVFCWFVFSPCEVIDIYRPSFIFRSVADKKKRGHDNFAFNSSKYKSPWTFTVILTVTFLFNTSTT